MWIITIGFGVVLAGLGVAGFVLTGMEHPTALIPSGFGVVLMLCGALASVEKLRMHVMHAAVLVGLIGLVGAAVMAGPKLPKLLTEGHVARADGSNATTAVVMQSLMGAICLAFVVLCVNSFVQARLARRRQAAPQPPV